MNTIVDLNDAADMIHTAITEARSAYPRRGNGYDPAPGGVQLSWTMNDARAVTWSVGGREVATVQPPVKRDRDLTDVDYLRWMLVRFGRCGAFDGPGMTGLSCLEMLDDGSARLADADIRNDNIVVNWA
jgi:hypothetical protein